MQDVKEEKTHKGLFKKKEKRRGEWRRSERVLTTSFVIQSSVKTL